MSKPIDEDSQLEGPAESQDEDGEDNLPPLTEAQRAASAKHFREQGKWHNR